MSNQEPTIRWASPAVDVLHREGSYRLLVDLPGVPKEAVELTVDDGTLNLVARRADQPEHGFRRRLKLPDAVDTEQIDAELKDGVLQVTLAPLPATRGRVVEVRA
jgi:HSP20 family protein